LQQAERQAAAAHAQTDGVDVIDVPSVGAGARGLP
jgi:hypothetical protein